ncbi:actinobacterial surface-anchored protein [Alloscardovia macacae]|uniref:Actinobacterial surface-anchored protein n=2 Tax=Alloscardovia macacae TaxID=1160091 RepID=A0A261F4L8_9BIFI|nr:actinobacterial surface-anchored protein [Alloscardovia macacae]
MMKNVKQAWAWGALAVAGVVAAALVCGALPGAHADELDQTVSSSEQISAEKTVLDVGHADLGPKVVDGRWGVYVRDDSGAEPVWRRAEDVVFRVKDAAQLDVPSGEEYAQLGAQAGERWWVIPQTQNPDVVWLGWNTQDPAASSVMDRGATMTLGAASGPAVSAGGRMALFVQEGTFDAPRFLVPGVGVQTSQDVWVDVNMHVHANWAFSAAGIYALPVRFCAKTTDGSGTNGTQCASSTLRFAVGDSTPAQDAFGVQAASLADASTQSQPESKPEAHDTHVSRETSSSNITTFLIGGICAVFIVARLALAAVRARAMKKEEELARKEVEHA